MHWVEHGADMVVGRDGGHAKQALAVRHLPPFLQCALVGEERLALHEEQRKSRQADIRHAVGHLAAPLVGKGRAGRANALQKGLKHLHADLNHTSSQSETHSSHQPFRFAAAGGHRSPAAAACAPNSGNRTMVHAPPRPPAGAPRTRINLYSDTQTRPTAAMKDAMMRAEVGDEQHGDDPTVHALCDRMAALTGKQAAMFLPSGTMCNVIAILTHCQKGDEIVAHETAHILTSEGGTHAALTGAQIMGLRGPRGMFSADDLRAAIRPKTRYTPPQRLLEVEQTANIGGGAVWPLAQLNAVAEIAHEQGWATHMDGARLMNACVAAGIAAKDVVAGYDSVWLDFTKGLGAPLGAVLCGSSEFIGAAWRWKQRLGGCRRRTRERRAGR